MSTPNIAATFGTLTADSLAIACINTWELVSAGTVRGSDFVVPGAAGEVPVDREAGPVFLEPRFRLNGKWVHATGLSTGTTEADWRGGLWDAWQIVHDVGTVLTTQTFTLTDTDAGKTFTTTGMIVTSPPVIEQAETPWIATVSMGIKLTGGTVF